MEEPFIATMKLVTGEEVIAEVSPVQENGRNYFVVFNPITIEETLSVDQRRGVVISGLRPKKWLAYANDNMTIIERSHVLTISELDKFGERFYNKALSAARIASPISRGIETKENTGYVDSINSARNKLEHLFEISPNSTNI